MLFEGKTRAVVLTAAGDAFITEARRALLHVERAVECGYAASRGETGVLSLGYSPWFRPSLLVTLRAELAKQKPGTMLSLHSAYSITQVELILKGTLHAGIIELPAKGEGLETHCVWHDELVVAIPENHPLANRAEIDRQDLAGEPIIWIARALNPGLHQYFLESCQRLGFAPRIAYEINTVSELFDLVGAGVGIGFVKRSITSRLHEQNVVFRELCGPSLVIDTGIAYRHDNQSEGLRALIQLVRDQSSAGGPR